MSAPSRRISVFVALAIGVGLATLSACRDNSFGGNLTPVPPVHRVPAEVEGTTVLLDEDPQIETTDPTHIARAKKANVPHDYRVAMVKALRLAGFRVVENRSEPHALVARLRLAVREDGENVSQTYRCLLREPSGAEIAQIDWPWPSGVFVDVLEVFDFASHNLATEVVTSRKVLAFVRQAREARPVPAPESPGAPAPASPTD